MALSLSTNLQGSTLLNSGAVMCYHMPHHVPVDGINGGPAADVCKHVMACDIIKCVNGPLLRNAYFSSYIVC